MHAQLSSKYASEKLSFSSYTKTKLSFKLLPFDFLLKEAKQSKTVTILFTLILRMFM